MTLQVAALVSTTQSSSSPTTDKRVARVGEGGHAAVVVGVARQMSCGHPAAKAVEQLTADVKRVYLSDRLVDCTAVKGRRPHQVEKGRL